MKAKKVYETFERGQDPRKSLNVGMGKRINDWLKQWDFRTFSLEVKDININPPKIELVGKTYMIDTHFGSEKDTQRYDIDIIVKINFEEGLMDVITYIKNRINRELNVIVRELTKDGKPNPNTDYKSLNTLISEIVTKLTK